MLQFIKKIKTEASGLSKRLKKLESVKVKVPQEEELLNTVVNAGYSYLEALNNYYAYEVEKHGE